MTVEGQLYLALILAFLVGDVVAYIMFATFAAIWNKVAKKQSLNGYVVGSVGVVLFTCLGVWYFVDMRDFRGTLLSEQVNVLVRALAVPFLLAMLVLGAVGIVSRLSNKS
jgi:hypothetical protein